MLLPKEKKKVIFSAVLKHFQQLHDQYFTQYLLEPMELP